MNRVGAFSTAVTCALLLTAMPVQAAIITFTDNPTGNSVDFKNAATAAGATTSVDVTFTGGSQNGVVVDSFGVGASFGSGIGPTDGNDITTPLSSGEGQHASSTYSRPSSPGAGTNGLTINFVSPVYGVGLFTIDYFGPVSTTNTLTLAAYSGASGTGTLLGTATALHANFQNNNLYFFGIESTLNNIVSAVFTRGPDTTADIIGIDDITVARLSGNPTSVPEPATMGLLGAALLAFASANRRKSAS